MSDGYDSRFAWEAEDAARSVCSYCGADHDGVEVEYCDSGEHCEMCCPNWDTCEEYEAGA